MGIDEANDTILLAMGKTVRCWSEKYRRLTEVDEQLHAARINIDDALRGAKSERSVGSIDIDELCAEAAQLRSELKALAKDLSSWNISVTPP